MVDFILDMAIMLSLGYIVYLVARTLPRIEDTNDSGNFVFKSHWITGYLERFDEWVAAYSEKFLRRTKVLTMRMDNSVSKRLHKFRKEAPKEAKLPIENGENSEELKIT